MDLREEAIKKIAEKYNLSIAEVSRIVRSQFLYIKENMSNYKETKTRYFGTFKVKKTKIKEVEEILRNETEQPKDN